MLVTLIQKEMMHHILSVRFVMLLLMCLLLVPLTLSINHQNYRQNLLDYQESVKLTNIEEITYVPARNTIFLSYALAYAEVLVADTIFIGVNAMDYSGYPDCRPEYINAYQTMANLATQAGVEGKTKLEIRAPLMDKTKAEIIQIGAALGVDYSLTFSCYDPDTEGRACGGCDSCLLRKRGFKAAGVSDPTRYI